MHQQQDIDDTPTLTPLEAERLLIAFAEEVERRMGGRGSESAHYMRVALLLQRANLRHAHAAQDVRG